MEGHINSGERNSSKATFQLDVTFSLLKVLGTGERRLDDLAEHFLDLLDGELLSELVKTQLLEPLNERTMLNEYLSNIDLLNLEIVEHIGQRLKSKELSSTDILLSFNVEVDNLEEASSVVSNGVYDFTESGVVEGSGDSTGVDSTHGVVGAILRVTLDGTLHGDTTVEDDIDERGDRENIGD